MVHKDLILQNMSDVYQINFDEYKKQEWFKVSVSSMRINRSGLFVKCRIKAFFIETKQSKYEGTYDISVEKERYFSFRYSKCTIVLVKELENVA